MPKAPTTSRTPRADTSRRRRDVLGVLRRSSVPLTIADLAGRLDLHVNTVRFHLDALEANGQVERVTATRRSPGRPPLLFRASPGMDPTGPRSYRLLAEILADDLAGRPDAARHATALGRSFWLKKGSRLARAGGHPERTRQDPIDQMIGVLDEWGFAPESRERDGHRQIGLRHCPFLELAVHRPQIACPIHLGLMQGALEEWGSSTTVDTLEQFVEPDLCVAHLAPTGGNR